VLLVESSVIGIIASERMVAIGWTLERELREQERKQQTLR
jgi:hypothetical protein